MLQLSLAHISGCVGWNLREWNSRTSGGPWFPYTCNTICHCSWAVNLAHSSLVLLQVCSLKGLPKGELLFNVIALELQNFLPRGIHMALWLSSFRNPEWSVLCTWAFDGFPTQVLLGILLWCWIGQSAAKCLPLCLVKYTAVLSAFIYSLTFLVLWIFALDIIWIF